MLQAGRRPLLPLAAGWTSLRPPPHPARFDDVFDESVDNSQLYEQAVQPLVGTFFRCGQHGPKG